MSLRGFAFVFKNNYGHNSKYHELGFRQVAEDLIALAGILLNNK